MAMEPHCERRHPPPLRSSPPHSRSSRARKPSFAASLLDAIYRSLDADPPTAVLPDSDPDPRKTKTTTRSDPHLAPIAAEARPRPSSASSSSAPSDSSSFGFSSDAEPPRPRPAPRRAPPRPDPPPPTPPRAKRSSIRSRIREFRKGRRGAPLSWLLRAILSSAGISRKHKPRAPPPPPQIGAVSVAGDEERVPGDADLAAAAAAAEARRRRVEELMRAMRTMRKEEEDDDDEDEEGSSDSSSDLFELGIACDELPVYETTHPTTINRSSARGLSIT